MYFGCCIYVLLLLNMPEMAHDWINKSILLSETRRHYVTSLFIGWQVNRCSWQAVLCSWQPLDEKVQKSTFSLSF